MNAPLKIVTREQDCYALLQKKKDGTLKANLSNARWILLDDPAWRGVIAFDEFARQAVACKRHPERDTTGAWTDLDDSAAAAWIARKYNIDIPTRTVMEAVQLVAECNKFHPVRDYLKKLKWDGTPRLHNLLAYFGAQETEYTKLVGVKFMVSAVARIFEPGCKVDNVMILEGLQGAGKSTALSILGGKWYMDTAINIGDKDSFQVMRGKWIIELGELDSLRKSECAAYLRAGRSTVAAWESGRSPVPFAEFELLRMVLESVSFKLSHPKWDGWFIGKNGALHSPDIGGNGFTPEQLVWSTMTRNEAALLRNEVTQLQTELNEAIAENTRLRQMFLSQGVVDELAAMHDKLSRLMDSIGTAHVIPFPSSGSEQTEQPQERAA